jgi:hypothetical protein
VKGDDDLEACAEACLVGTPPDTGSDNYASSLPSQSGNAEEEKVAPNCAPEKIAPLSAAKNPHMSWTEMDLQMQADGLKYIPGCITHTYWYIHPGCITVKKGDLISNYVEGEHYFKGEDSLKSYARNKLGWIGGTADMKAQEAPRSRTRRANSTADSPFKRSLSKGPNSSAKKARKSPKAASKTLTGSTQQPEADSVKEDAPNELFADPTQTVKQQLLWAQHVLHPSYKHTYCSVSSLRDDVMAFMSKSVETGMLVDGAPATSPVFLCKNTS